MPRGFSALLQPLLQRHSHTWVLLSQAIENVLLGRQDGGEALPASGSSCHPGPPWPPPLPPHGVAQRLCRETAVGNCSGPGFRYFLDSFKELVPWLLAKWPGVLNLTKFCIAISLISSRYTRRSAFCGIISHRTDCLWYNLE